MRFVKEGEKSKAVCDNCGLTTITYALRDLDFSDKSGTVKDVLAGVCDTCNEVIVIPAQSTPQIKTEYNKVRKSIEIRVPAHYVDILNQACQKIDSNLDESFFKVLVIFYIHSLSLGEISAKDIEKLLKSDIAKAKSSKRLSFKITQKTEKDFVNLISMFGLKSKSDVVKGIILKINEDIVQPKQPKYLNKLKSLATAFY
jgi:hypothetical protein